jgi:hypothetical protein
VNTSNTSLDQEIKQEAQDTIGVIRAGPRKK